MSQRRSVRLWEVTIFELRGEWRRLHRMPPPMRLSRPGTRLVREWHGVTHTALMHADGIEWRGQRYPPFPWSRERSPAPAGRARGSSASGSGS
jgi:Protein of unknown function (DUF2924)